MYPEIQAENYSNVCTKIVNTKKNQAKPSQHAGKSLLYSAEGQQTTTLVESFSWELSQRRSRTKQDCAQWAKN